ncbi:hypothetical protein [Arthrobacter crystallopoietes]|uniref:Uncharacterized protein n=1 Tax=Crystallibacter crystallopoietes TaxID=37928 RepID=A0A1H0XLC7_9MICC|nr:hypothetical protein [Arthrobacter crystallopoietes]SDQ03609.1 hypothetical protein SAMN04489742_0123 [Arthrobacter crystallopoietes]
MNDWIPAAVLWGLTLVRLPTVRNREALPAFWGSLFASIAFTLYVPSVYLTVDNAMGGGNIAGLILSEFVIAALWQIQRSLQVATTTGTVSARDRPWVRWWAVCSLAMLLTYPGWNAPESTRWMVSVYGAHPALLVFQTFAVTFIMTVSVSALRICWPRMNQMEGLFGAGFRMVLAGFGIALMIAGMRLYGNFLPPGSGAKAAVEQFFELAQQVIVILVSLGLSLPRLTAVAQKFALTVRAAQMLRTIQPIWQGVASAEMDLVIDSKPYSKAEFLSINSVARLQRRVSEIRDAEIRARTSGYTMDPQSAEIVREVETLLYNYPDSHTSSEKQRVET